MFGFLKKSQDSSADGFAAPVDGKCISIEEVADAVFSSKMMGDGFAIVPTGETVVAPADGEIVMIPESKHAFGMKTKDGVELLVHIGLDTVNLNGQGFEVLTKQGTRVKAGTPIIRFDRSFMDKQGIDLTTMLVFTGGYDKPVVLSCLGQEVKAGDKVL